MDCSKRVASVWAMSLLLPACTSFSATSGDTDDGSTGAAMTASTTTPVSSSSSTDPTSTTDEPSSSTTDEPSSSSTDPTSTTDPSSSTTDPSTSSSDGTSSGSESSESGQMCEGELCGRDCIDLDNDPAHCGECDAPCSTQNATATCAVGECVLSCDEGFDDCDVDVTNGCEQPLDTPVHCGACEQAGVSEICDGLDNDCAGGVDDGCPMDVALADGTFDGHAVFGNALGGDAFEDVCPAGTALVGFSGNVGGNVDRIRGVCAAMTLDIDTGVTPYDHAITTGPTTILSTHGSNVTTPFAISCPSDHFVVGITGDAGVAGLHDVTIHCAQVLVTGTPGAFALSYGPITMEAVDGTNIGIPYSDLLVEPAVVDRYRGRAGNWVDAIGIGEATVTLSLIE